MTNGNNIERLIIMDEEKTPENHKVRDLKLYETYEKNHKKKINL